MTEVKLQKQVKDEKGKERNWSTKKMNDKLRRKDKKKFLEYSKENFSSLVRLKSWLAAKVNLK